MKTFNRFRSASRRLLAGVIASLLFTAFLGCADQPSLGCAPLVTRLAEELAAAERASVDCYRALAPGPTMLEARAARPVFRYAQLELPPAAPPPAPVAPASLDDPLAYVRILFEAIASGQWPVAGAALLVLVVVLLRLFGKKLHAHLPDDHFADQPLYFLFTRPGGWVLNVLTAVAGGLGTALLAGQPITMALVKPMFTVAIAGAGLFQLVKDVLEWWKSRKATAAGLAAAAGIAGADDAKALLLRGPQA